MLKCGGGRRGRRRRSEDDLIRGLLSTAMLPTTLTNLLIVLLSTATSTDAVEPQIPFRDTGARPVLSFEPRHMHAVSSSGHVVFADLPSIRAGHMPSDLLSDPALGLAYTIDTRRTRTHRPPSSAAVSQARARRRRPPNPLAAQSFPDDFVGWWEEDEVLGPDIERRETLLLLAKMANNAYLNPNDTLWYDLGDGWNAVRLSRATCIDHLPAVLR